MQTRPDPVSERSPRLIAATAPRSLGRYPWHLLASTRGVGPRPEYALFLQLIQELRRHAKEAYDALMMKLVVAAKLQYSALLNLNVDDVLYVEIVRQNNLQNQADRIVLQRENDEILPW